MQCKSCGVTSQGKYDFCPNCGAYMKQQGEHRLHMPNFHRPHAAPPPKAEKPPAPNGQGAAGKTVPEAASQLPGAIPERSVQRAAHPAPPQNLPVPVPEPLPDGAGWQPPTPGNGSGHARGVSVEVLSRVLGRPVTSVQVTRAHEPYAAYIGLIAFMAVWFLALLLGFGAAGVYQGMQDRTRIAIENAEQHKALARQYIKEGNIVLATEELKFARQFNPNDPEILDLLASLQPTPVPVPSRSASQASQPTPTAPPVPTPTLTKVSQEEILGSLLAQARQAFNTKDFETAVTTLENLRRVEPNYKKTEVEDLLVDSYLALARQYLSQERYEEAVQKFDRALAIRKNDDVALERYLAANYQQGLSSWGADWKRAADAFAEIVKINPEYLDSRTRLYQAYINYGDYLVKMGSACAAVTPYDLALAMAPTGQLQSARSDAAAACAAGGGVAATPRPGQTPAPGRTPVPTPSGSGKYTVQVLPTFQNTNDDTGSIRGRVADKESRPIIRLEMVVTSTTKQYQRVETTDDFGFYGFDGLDADTYTVRVANDPASISAPVTVGRKVRALIDFTKN